MIDTHMKGRRRDRLERSCTSREDRKGRTRERRRGQRARTLKDMLMNSSFTDNCIKRTGAELRRDTAA